MDHTTPIKLAPQEREKLAQLRRIKRLATGALITCFAVFLLARYLPAPFPQWAGVLGFIAAFAEAATIGGLADWYAVVVLFRHPVGLKIPHTAIIPTNQERIADNLGQFLERNFLTKPVIREKLEDIDFSAHIIDWLGSRERSEQISKFAMRLIPDILAAIEDSGFRDFAAGKIAQQVQKTDIAPVTTNLIDSFVKDGRYQILLDEMIKGLRKILNDEESLKTIQKRVADELPTVLYVLQADTVILKRIVRASGALFNEISENPDHPMRREFQELFEDYVDRMKKSKRFANRVERFKQEILQRPEIASLADQIWENLGDYVARDAKRKTPVLSSQLSSMLVDLARQLQMDQHLCRDINRGLTETLTVLVEDQKEEVAGFVASQVKSWNFKQLVTLIEANVGKDLQYIRFNGMLIGGIAGLILHAFDVALLPWHR